MRILLCHNRYQMRAGKDFAFDFTKALLERGGMSGSFTRGMTRRSMAMVSVNFVESYR